MSEGHINLADDSEGDVNADSFATSADHLATTRLPSVLPALGPLPPARVPSVPPAAVAPLSPPAFSPAVAPAPGIARPAGQRGSWWKALLGSTQPAAGANDAQALDDRAARQLVSGASASVGLLMILLGLVVGLREAPTALLFTPVVAAAVVVGRAAVSVAMLVVGLTFVRAAERVYFR
jgi:hypothetical protein